MTLEVGFFGEDLTPEQILLDALSQRPDAVVLVVRKGTKVGAAWSDGSKLEYLGMLEFGKSQIMEGM